ncbi:MAG: hypothetical protein WAL75_11085 [Terracidiphilus sp.]
MSLAELNSTLHASFSMPSDQEEKACFYVSPADHPKIGLMILNGRLERVDVEALGVQTDKGIHNGDSESDAIRAYGKSLKVTPHAYTAPEGHYLTVRSPKGSYGIRFETYKGRIVKYYAGRLDAISFIEGCD